ncbi:MAG: class I SAM-dependent methyltransferase [Actinomycetota bacterium]
MASSFVPDEVFDSDYDLLHEDYLTSWQSEQDLHELMMVLEGRTGRLLDIPCGTGRLAHRLGLLGFDVLGVDANERFITQGKRQADGLNGAAELRVGDLREVGSLGTFDVIINWFNSFGYFSTAINNQVLEGFASVLRPSGCLLINTLDLSEVASVLRDGPLEEEVVAGVRRIMTSASLEDGRLVTIRTAEGGGPASQVRSSVELLDRDQWTARLEHAGFGDVTFFTRSSPTGGAEEVELTIRALKSA